MGRKLEAGLSRNGRFQRPRASHRLQPVVDLDSYGNPPGSRLFLYDDPTPPGVIAPRPTARVMLPFGQAAASVWDEFGRFAIADHNWNRVVLVWTSECSGSPVPCP